MARMGIVLFAVCTVFGVSSMVLWAALSSARLKLAQSKQLIDALLQAVDRDAPLSASERAALREQRAAVYGET
jgi:hypothetical protein